MDELDVDRYFESERERSSLRGVDLSTDTPSGRAARGVRDVMRRLDALPRDDPFWSQTNRRTTIHKVSHYASALVARDPADVQAWWALVGMDLWWCANEFGSAGWRGLHSLGLLDVAWPVRAAHEVYVSSGADPAPLLARLVTELGIERNARSTLSELASADRGARDWVDRVVAELDRGAGGRAPTLEGPSSRPLP